MYVFDGIDFGPVTLATRAQKLGDEAAYNNLVNGTDSKAIQCITYSYLTDSITIYVYLITTQGTELIVRQCNAFNIAI